MSVRSQILAQLEQVAREQDKPLVPLVDELPLLHSGLDSLCLAVLVARLEDTLGVDPFSNMENTGFPVTVGDLVRFYERAAQSQSDGVCSSSLSQ